VARRVKILQDDLLFTARVQAHTRRLGLPTEVINPSELPRLAADPDSVLVMQLTLRPELQLATLEGLRSRLPSQPILAVCGHLESGLRRQAKALGVQVASHSGLERALARATAAT